MPVHAQTPDLSLPPLPELNGDMPPLPMAAEPLPAAAPTAAATPAAAPATTDTADKQAVGSRAGADSIDDLLPATAAKPPVAATTATQAGNDTLAPLPNTPPVADNTGIAATSPAPSETAAAPTTPPALPPLPAQANAPAENDLPMPKPMSLAEEAAAKGMLQPELALPPMPEATAQALLTGQPLGSYDDEEPELPEVKVKRKPSIHDLPKLKPSIAPLRNTYNYQRQILPPSIYKREYTAENRHLPKATTREDYDRHLFGAVAANNVNATRAFLEMGKSVNLANANGETLLMVAVRYGALDTARLLLARGADPRLSGAAGMTPLSLAESTGQRTMAEVLRARGA